MTTWNNLHTNIGSYPNNPTNSKPNMCVTEDNLSVSEDTPQKGVNKATPTSEEVVIQVECVQVPEEAHGGRQCLQVILCHHQLLQCRQTPDGLRQVCEGVVIELQHLQLPAPSKLLRQLLEGRDNT